MYCRLCLSKFRNKRFLSLLSCSGGYNWKKLCWEYLHIVIKNNDNFSKGVCQKCSKLLKKFHEFCQNAQHCQRLLPQLQLEVEEAKNTAKSTQNPFGYVDTVNLEPIEQENSLEIPKEIGSNNTVNSDLPNEKAIFVITETIESENSLEKSSCCTRLDSEEQSTIVVKTEILENDTNLEPPIMGNHILGGNDANKQVEPTLAIKSEPIEHEFVKEASNIEKETIKNENFFETTDYEMHVPVFRTHIDDETPTKKLRTSLVNCDENIQNKERNQSLETKDSYSKNLRLVDCPFDLDEEMFRKTYRMSPKLAQFLIQTLDTQLRGTRITANNTEKLVLAALRFYATGCCQRLKVGSDSDTTTSLPSISRAVQKVTDAINGKMCQNNIRFPMTNIERQAAKNAFAIAPAPFYGAIGAIDCMHVGISKPKEDPVAYLNKYGYHSINVQMICDPSLKILNVNARYAGSKQNAYIWNASAARNVMQRAFVNGDRHAFLIGDAKYPLEPWLMTPLLNTTKDTPDFRYNVSLLKARNPVQRLFRVLKGTWRCLSDESVLMYHPQFAGRIVNACSVLHNLKLSQKECYAEDFIDLEIPNNQINFDADESSNSTTDFVLLSTAKSLQNHIITTYFSK